MHQDALVRYVCSCFEGIKVNRNRETSAGAKKWGDWELRDQPDVVLSDADNVRENVRSHMARLE